MTTKLISALKARILSDAKTSPLLEGFRQSNAIKTRNWFMYGHRTLPRAKNGTLVFKRFLPYGETHD